MTRHQVWKARERARFLFIATQARAQRLRREQGLTQEVIRLRELGNRYAKDVSEISYKLLTLDRAAGRHVKPGKRLDPYGVFTG